MVSSSLPDSRKRKRWDGGVESTKLELELTEQPPLYMLVSELLLDQSVVPQEDLSTCEVVGSVSSIEENREGRKKNRQLKASQLHLPLLAQLAVPLTLSGTPTLPPDPAP